MDVLGLLVALVVTVANVQDREAVPLLLRAGKEASSRLEKVLVDGAYTGEVIKQASLQTGVNVTGQAAGDQGFPRGAETLDCRTHLWLDES